MKPYSELTKAEKLLLTGDTFLEAVKVDALTNGIAIPISYGDAIKQLAIQPYITPTEHVRVYELRTEYSQTGICYLSEEQAINALQGAYFVGAEGWPAKTVIKSGHNFRVHILDVAAVQGKVLEVVNNSPIEERLEDLKPFNDLLESNRLDWEKTLQEQYSCERRAVRRQTYLDLAKGNLEIAQSFWRNVEKTNWPNAQGEIE